jgi:hypothetical protein
MDLWKYINELYEEKRRLDKLIDSLEVLQTHQRSQPGGRSRRGRKPGMPDEERQLVSERMKRYWAERRAAGATAGTEGDSKTQAAGAGGTTP